MNLTMVVLALLGMAVSIIAIVRDAFRDDERFSDENRRNMRS